jgi:transposase-like protein
VVRDHLSTIGELAPHLPDEAAHGARSLRSDLPGGDALVLLTPGNYTGSLSPNDERRNDPRPLLVVLNHWETWWRTRHHHPTRDPLTLGRTLDYLSAHLHRMAEDPAFPNLAREVSRTRRQLENVLYDGVRPEVSRVPCWECGTRLVKEYGDTVAEDHWRCPKCGERYDRGRYDRAKHDHLASQGAERYVPVAIAVAAVGRPEQTVRAWIKRELVQARRDPVTGRLFVWWPDVRTAHLTTTRRRRGAAS